MPQDQSNDPSDSVFEEAAGWHARLREAGSLANPPADFLAWIDRPQHRAAFEEVQRLWTASAVPALRVAAETPAIFPAPYRRARRGFPTGSVMAASILLALAAGIWLRQGGFDDLRSDHVAATGEQRSIALADGSLIVLNTDTAIDVDLQPQGRIIRMFRGEAFFKVARDPVRPFIVQTDSGEIRVIGTSFNLRLSEHGTVVSVADGQVEAANGSGAQIRLKAKQQAVLNATGVTSAQEFDLARVSAWQRGQIVFYRTPLSEVVHELNRYQPGKILIWNDQLREQRVSGVFDARDPAAAIHLIARTLPVRVTRVAGGLTLLR